MGRFQYTGQAWIAELGLYHYKARLYSPTLGRFLQTDPIGYDDDFNLYAYVKNDPLNKADPTGTCDTGSLMPSAKTTGCKVYGTPQVAGSQGHYKASVKLAEKLAQEAVANGERVDDVPLQQGSRERYGWRH